MSEQPPKWSLNSEIKKRKTQETLRQIEMRRASQTMRSVQPSPTPTTPLSSTSQAKRDTQSVPASKQTTQVAAAVRPSVWYQRRYKFLAIASFVAIALICMGVGLTVNSQEPATTPTLLPLPTASASDTVAYLVHAGLTIDKNQPFTVPDTTWNAKQAVQFTAHQDSKSGTFLVLSYDSPAAASIDVFRAGSNQKYKAWTLSQIANVLVLSSPKTAGNLRSVVTGHISSYLVAPYRSFLPTVTPRP